MTKEIRYSQGMTHVWSDGDKIVVTNVCGIKHVETNVDNIFGVGMWNMIHEALYTEHNLDRKHKIKKYECVSGYIPQRVLDDLAALPDEELPEDVQKENALEALRNV